MATTIEQAYTKLLPATSERDGILTKEDKAKLDSLSDSLDLSDYVKESELAAVATSGSYNDLTDKPTIPDISAKQDTLVSGANIKTINNESILGSGDITIDLSVFKVVSALPTEEIDANKIYLVPAETTETGNVYIEYVYANSAWEKLGEYRSDVDLTDYIKSDDLADWAKSTTKPSYDYSEIANTPNIPSLNGYATESWVEGKGYLTEHQDISGKQDALSTTQLAAVNSGITSDKVSTYDGYATTISNKVDKEDGKGLSTNDYTTADKTKLDAIQDYTIGEGLTVEDGVLKCSFVPARYYTGSSTPIDTSGNNGDLYLLINE